MDVVSSAVDVNRPLLERRRLHGFEDHPRSSLVAGRRLSRHRPFLVPRLACPFPREALADERNPKKAHWDGRIPTLQSVYVKVGDVCVDAAGESSFIPEEVLVLKLMFHSRASNPETARALEVPFRAAERGVKCNLPDCASRTGACVLAR